LPKKTVNDLVVELPEEERTRIETQRAALRRAGITTESLKGMGHREIARLVDRVLKDAGVSVLPSLNRDPVLVEQAQRIVAALHEAGVDVSDFDDLVHRSAPYPQAIPVLIRFLPENLDRKVKHTIVFALSVKEARGLAAKPLLQEFERLPMEPEFDGLKWAIGNALTIVADKTDFDEIARLIRDKRHGTSRQMMVEALGKMRDPRAVDILLPLLKDEDVYGHTIVSLGETRDWRARRHIEPFVDHPYGWIQSAAKRALRKIDRERERQAVRNQSRPKRGGH